MKKFLTIFAFLAIQLITYTQNSFAQFCCDGACDYSINANSALDMKTNRIYYYGDGYAENDYDVQDAIGIGFHCSDPLPGRLSVNQENNNQLGYTMAGYFHNGDISGGGVKH